MHPPVTLGPRTLRTVIAAGPDAKDAQVGRTALVCPWIGLRPVRALPGGHGQSLHGSTWIGIQRPGGYADHC